MSRCGVAGQKHAQACMMAAILASLARGCCCMASRCDALQIRIQYTRPPTHTSCGRREAAGLRVGAQASQRLVQGTCGSHRDNVQCCQNAIRLSVTAADRVLSFRFCGGVSEDATISSSELTLVRHGSELYSSMRASRITAAWRPSCKG